MPGPSRATSPAGPAATLVAIIALACAGCAVGPSYHAPPAPTAKDWLDTDDPRLKRDQPPAHWWMSFDDPVLTRLVETAYARNPTLEAAGLRVIQARARRAIAIGQLFPQTQEITGSYTHSTLSSNVSFGSATIAGVIPGSTFPAIDVWQLGAEAAWEIDLWGRYRRGIEAASADVLASLASYDDVLVSLVAQVASEYVAVRVLEERLLIARDNVRTEQESLDIARIRFEAGGTSNLDVQQALTLLRDTEATIPQLEAQLHQATDVLSVLLGLPPQELGDLIGEPGRIPTPPATIAVGIPAELVWRRPDVRAAERAAAAQSARIGVAFADLLPRVELTGTVGLSADDAARLFEGNSFTGTAGPRFDWPVLNYGRIINNVRVQDATFQELVARWIDTVLRAQQEVEDAIAGYLGGLEGVSRLEESVTAANQAVELSTIQYREGAADFTRVLNSQQQKLREDDLLAQTRGQVASSVIGLYRALGGGWELRDGRDVVPRAVKHEMRRRTWWGWMLGREPGPGDARVEERR